MSEEQPKKRTTSAAQAAATKRWNEKHRDRRRYLSKRSTARGFIRNDATADDLAELTMLIEQRKQVID